MSPGPPTAGTDRAANNSLSAAVSCASPRNPKSAQHANQHNTPPQKHTRAGILMWGAPMDLQALKL